MRKLTEAQEHHNTTIPTLSDPTMAQYITEAAPNTPYFTPAQKPPAGTAAPSKDGTPIPSLFQPIKIRGVEFQNRLFVRSSRDG